MIDIVIPAYKAEKTIERCLNSIAMQTIIDDCMVTIVSDGDGVDYNRYSYLIPEGRFRVIECAENGGPGDARQVGLDNATGTYITFIDADDTFGSCYALEGLRRDLDANPNVVLVAGNFFEEHSNFTFIPHPNDLIWMFGKLYRRKFLVDNDIHFLKGSRSNEDNGFNTTIRLIADQTQIHFTQNCVYYWMYSENTITRANNADYTYNASFPGYVDNMIFAIERGREINPFSPAIGEWTVQVMCQLYVYYVETLARAPQYAERNLEYVKKFSPLFFSYHIPKKAVDNIMAKVLKGCYTNNRLDGIVPNLTFEQFLDAVRV